MNRQRWLRTRRRLKERQGRRELYSLKQINEEVDEFFEELKRVLPKPYADYVPDMPWERRWAMTETAPVIEITRPMRLNAPCHSLDLWGRPLCGAVLTGHRSGHPIGTCVVDGHPRCSTCDSLMASPLEGLGPEFLEAS